MSFKTIFKGLLIAASFISTNLVAMEPDQLYQDSLCSHTTSYNTHSDGAEQAWNNSVRSILQLSFALHALKHVIYPSTADTL